MKIPSLILKQLYTFGSLTNEGDGFRFGLKNRLSDATLTRLVRLRVDDGDVPLASVTLELGDGRVVPAGNVSAGSPAPFPLRQVAWVRARGPALALGRHDIRITFESEPFGALEIRVQDAIAHDTERRDTIPYDREGTDDYSPRWVAERQRFVERFAGVKLQHIDKYSFDPSLARGNCENFTGVAQVPLGFAGPLRVNGEHAQGDFIIPLATSEGTLVASYNRGMKVLNLAGGVTCTVSADCMQRAPVFVFESAREAREFAAWVDAHVAEIRAEAEATSHVARLQLIDTYLSNKFAFLRFNFATGDAAGQNMVGRATFAACSWILEHGPAAQRFFLESNLATDKKASQVNVMKTRGKRVTAECTIPRTVLVDHLRVEPDTLHAHADIANVGAILSGANNNGLHSANAITAMFIATGQDVANVSESSAGIIFTEVTPAGDLYLSITIPSLIVATHGGGTALPTQHECLAILGCLGRNSVRKLAEIVAGVVLAGELSLASAISSQDWVSSHERYGRHR